MADLSRLVWTSDCIDLPIDCHCGVLSGYPGPPQHQGLRHPRRLPQLRGGAVPRRAHGRHAHLLRPVRQRRGDREPRYLLSMYLSKISRNIYISICRYREKCQVHGYFAWQFNGSTLGGNENFSVTPNFIMSPLSLKRRLCEGSRRFHNHEKGLRS